MATPRAQYLRLTWTDPVTGRQGFLVIDRLVRGLAGGGTRIRAGCTLEEVSRLAATMSLKNGVLGIPAGGAKCGIDCDPQEAESLPLLHRFVRAMYPLWDTYVATGEDLGVQQSTLDAVFADVGLGIPMRAALRGRGDLEASIREMRGVLSLDQEGTPLIDLVGGYGVAAAASAALERVSGSVDGARVVVQGFGSMGGSAARYLSARGALVTGIADVRGLIVNQDGLDVHRLLAARDEFGVIDRAVLSADDRELPRDEWIALECDILVPAAVADAINPANCDRIRTRLVVEAANLPTTAQAEERLLARGVTVIPDFVANSGTNGWAWWLALDLVGHTAEDAFRLIDDVIPQAVQEALDRAAEHRVSPREAARSIAQERLDLLAAEHGVEGPLRLPVL